MTFSIPHEQEQSVPSKFILDTPCKMAEKSARWMELEKTRMDLKQELKLQKKQIPNQTQDEIAKIREEYDGDVNCVGSLSD
ncbi:hypothetical protein Tco_1408181 [Tanacetum coccineum]